MPDENIGKNLEELCIRRGSLKYLDDEIVDANLKKQTPKLVTAMASIFKYAGTVRPDFLLISQVKNSEGHAKRLEVCRFHFESRLPNICYGHTNKKRVDIIINPPSLIHTSW